MDDNFKKELRYQLRQMVMPLAERITPPDRRDLGQLVTKILDTIAGPAYSKGYEKGHDDEQEECSS
jgi:hypothetical protein